MIWYHVMKKESGDNINRQDVSTGDEKDAIGAGSPSFTKANKDFDASAI
jgi:hypothetical protein